MQDGRIFGRNWSLIKSQTQNMAGFKTQIIAHFKVKFPKVTLSKERLNSIADKLDAKTDDEDSIDGNLDAMNEFFPFADIQKADDKIRDLETQVKKPKTETTTEEKPTPEPGKDDTPEWAKGLFTGIQTLTSELTALKGEKITTSRKELLAEKLKDAPEAFKNKILKDFDRMKFDKDEDFTEYLTETETDLGEFVQAESNSGLGRDKPRSGANGGKPGAKGEASQAEIDAIFKDVKI